MQFTYVSAEELLILHALVIDETGGSHGVRDIQLFASIIEKPKTAFGGADLYPDILTKAAAFTEALVNYYVFVDGNKRTAFAGLMRFLDVNGHALSAGMKEIEDTMVSLADKTMSMSEFTEWLSASVTRQ